MTSVTGTTSQPDRVKSHQAAASQFFVAAELSRLGLVAALTLGNSQDSDVLVSNKSVTRFVHVQMKTYLAGKNKSATVREKAEVDYGTAYFRVRCILLKDSSDVVPQGGRRFQLAGAKRTIQMVNNTSV